MAAALRLRERFARFVLFNTAAFRSSRIPWRIRICRTPLLGTLAVRGANAFCRRVSDGGRAAQSHDARRQGGHRRAVRWLAKPSSNRQFVPTTFPCRRRASELSTLTEIEHGLSLLADRPFQFIWGMRDWCFTPAFLYRFLEFYPHAEVHRIEDAGHWVVEDAHERIVPLVERFIVLHAASPAL